MANIFVSIAILELLLGVVFKGTLPDRRVRSDDLTYRTIICSGNLRQERHRNIGLFFLESNKVNVSLQI